MTVDIWGQKRAFILKHIIQGPEGHNRLSGNVGTIDAEPARNIWRNLAEGVGITALRSRPKWAPRTARKQKPSNKQDLVIRSRQALS